ncbi:MAG TPA: NUDIX domain-containing protein [Mycobacteriales bacterium]|jgi:predicted NUDIX family NTP pyrophosphohydrolase|nr:NUDIX domain-containing protein [Mycobacteriales bacterium]
MAAVTSAGILLFRWAADDLEVLLGHMGGPFWSRKDEAAWSIPKGIYIDGEEPLAAALREFTEELGLAPPVEPDALQPLGELRQPSGKRLTIWAAEGDLDPADVVPGVFTMEWPPRSGTMAEFPEIDRAQWWRLDDARVKLVKGQRPFLDRLVERVSPLRGDA